MSRVPSTSLLSVLLLGALGGCPAPPPPEPPKASTWTASDQYNECKQQEALEEASSCWKMFLDQYKTSAGAAEIAYAEEHTSATANQPTCDAGKGWDGKECKSLCDAKTEVWDNHESVCMRFTELDCREYTHRGQDGRCVPDDTCPDGMVRTSTGCAAPPKPRFAPGVRVTSLIDQQLDGKTYVKQGAKGTFACAQNQIGLVIWDQRVGLKPNYCSEAPPGKQDYGYWVMLDEITEDGSAATTVPVPQWCGQQSSAPKYGAIKVGSVVKLGRHRTIEGADQSDNWATEMQPFVGKIGVVSGLSGVDPMGCPVVKVTADKGKWNWRIRDMTILGVERKKADPGAPSSGPTMPN